MRRFSRFSCLIDQKAGQAAHRKASVVIEKQITKRQARKAKARKASKSKGSKVLVYCFKCMVVYVLVYIELFEVVQRCGVNVLP